MWPSGRDRIIHLNVGEIVKVEGLMQRAACKMTKRPYLFLCNGMAQAKNFLTTNTSFNAELNPLQDDVSFLL